MTFQPAPRKNASSSWITLPLPRTGPSRRCRLQLMTKVRLSSSSRAATPIAPSDSGSSISPSPRNAHTCCSAGVLDAAVVQVAVEPGLVDRVDRPEAHRDGRELPEVRHQPRVRVRRQPAAGVRELLPEAVQLLLGEPALEERAGVHAGGGVALEEDLVAAAGVVLAAEEVVEADLVERRGRGVGRDVAADADAGALRPVHHDRGVPPDVGADAPLDVLVAGEPRLALGRDRVDVVGAAQARDADLALAGPLEQAQHEVAGAVAARVRRSTASSDSSHSAVSSGSMSGSWLGRPSLMIAGRSCGDVICPSCYLRAEDASLPLGNRPGPTGEDGGMDSTVVEIRTGGQEAVHDLSEECAAVPGVGRGR